MHADDREADQPCEAVNGLGRAHDRGPEYQRERCSLLLAVVIDVQKSASHESLDERIYLNPVLVRPAGGAR